VGGERTTRKLQALLWVEEDRRHLSATALLPSSSTPCGSACINQQLLAGDFVPVNSHTNILAALDTALFSPRCLPGVAFCCSHPPVRSRACFCVHRGDWACHLRTRIKLVLVLVFFVCGCVTSGAMRSHHPPKLPTTCLILFPLFCRRGSTRSGSCFTKLRRSCHDPHFSLLSSHLLHLAYALRFPGRVTTEFTHPLRGTRGNTPTYCYIQSHSSMGKLLTTDTRL